MAKPDWLPYAAELEAELTRVHRRALMPVYLFAACFGALFLVAWLHHFHPQAPVPFVQELR